MRTIGKYVFIILLACAMSGCLPQNGITGRPAAGSPSPRPTLTSVGVATAGTPALTPTPGPGKGTAAPQTTAEKAMLRDIDFLIKNSEYQQGQESNYKNVGKEQLLTVESVTDKEIRFTGKPQVFTGDYTGQFTAGQSYPYFEDAAMGGQRFYNVKDNFGVWVIFKYTVPI